MKSSPLSYQDAAVLALEAGQELLSRLDLMKLQPKTVLCLGLGSALLVEALRQRYPSAEVVEYVGEGTCCDVEQAAKSLALEERSVDFIFANFMLPWVDRYEDTLRQCRALLSSDGLLMLTAMGPESFSPYLREMSDYVIPKGIDMHDMGDLIMQSGLADPVLDVSTYTLVYRQADKLLHEMIASHMLDPAAATLALQPSEGEQFAIHFEVIHAHAFASSLKAKKDFAGSSEVAIPVSMIKRSKQG